LTERPKSEKPHRKRGLRFRIWVHYKWNHVPPETRRFLRNLTIVVIGEAAILSSLIAIGYAISANLLQLPTVISFGVVELFAFILYKMFVKEKDETHSAMEYMAVADNLQKYAHLVIHYADIGLWDEGYPNKPLYVINTETMHAYWVPIYLRELAKLGAIQRVKHDTEDELYAFLNSNTIAIVKDYPRNDALGVTSQGRISDQRLP
jgi:hypothetical protein